MMSNAAFSSDRVRDEYESGSPQSDSMLRAIRELISGLRPDDRQRLMAELIEQSRPSPTPKAGDVLGTIVKFLPRQKNWTVAAIKESVEKEGVEASTKAIYNALGYLTRKKHVTRVGYGQYVVDGMLFITSDDFGGQRPITEEDSDN